MLFSTLVAWLFYRQAKRSRVQAGEGRGGGVIIFSLKLFCIAELSLHAEFYILIKFCGGWSISSKETESPSRGEGRGVNVFT